MVQQLSVSPHLTHITALLFIPSHCPYSGPMQCQILPCLRPLHMCFLHTNIPSSPSVFLQDIHLRETLYSASTSPTKSTQIPLSSKLFFIVFTKCAVKTHFAEIHWEHTKLHIPCSTCKRVLHKVPPQSPFKILPVKRKKTDGFPGAQRRIKAVMFMQTAICSGFLSNFEERCIW